jgi:hypothetical protein
VRKISLSKFVRDTFNELKDVPFIVTKNEEPYVHVEPFVIMDRDEALKNDRPFNLIPKPKKK